MLAAVRFLLRPGGLISLLIYAGNQLMTKAYTIPIIILKHVFHRQTCPKNWDILLDIFAHLMRFVQTDPEMMRTYMDVYTFFELQICRRIYNIAVKEVDNKVKGAWIYDLGSSTEHAIVPKAKDLAWNDICVYLYCHGGGFGCGSSGTGILLSLILGTLMHQKVIEHYKLFSNRRLLVFAIDYPLSPEHKYPTQINFAVSCYKWLVNDMGCSNIIFGGDSAGGNLTIAAYSELLKDPSIRIMPRKLVLISPWLDVSMSHLPPESQEEIATYTDILSFSMCEKWRDNLVPSGVSARDRIISPFFSLEQLIFPSEGMLIIYGDTELFAPIIENYIDHLKRPTSPSSFENTSHETNRLKVIVGAGMPHNFPVILNTIPSTGYGKANRAIFEIARFISVPSAK